MATVLQIIRLLVIIQLSKIIRCQDGFSEQDILRFQQMPSNDAQAEAMSSYSANLFQRDPNVQSITSANTQFQSNDDSNKSNNNFGRTLYSRSKKVYRIKNPFQNQLEEAEKQIENTEPQDSGAGASNQYASMQYSLPPEEFLQQLRAENQYYQQTQISTPAPNLGYTATPQPQYQYSTVSPLSYDNNQQSINNNNQIQLEPKVSNGPTYLSSPSPYQFSTPNTFLDNVQSSPSPIPSYLSTPLNNGQFSETQSSSYVSSISPVYLSSPSNLQSYVSSPLSVIQTGSPDYSSRITTTIGSFDNSDLNKKMHIDHYDYSGNGIRFPMNVQQQYQGEYASTTTTTTSSPYSSHIRESWQNANSNINAAPKSGQDGPYTQYQNYPYNNNQQDTRLDNNSDNVNSETHRIGSVAAPNNLYVNYAQPDSQGLNNMKIRTRDIDHETGQQEIYSNGEFGWKLTGKKPLIDVFSSGNYQRYPPMSMSSDGPAVSQMNFHMDTSKRYGYDQVSKSGTESVEAQEFAKAAANAHERLKQQQQQQQQQLQQQQQQQQQQLHQQYYGSNSNYGSNNNYGSNSNMATNPANPATYFSNNDKQKSKYSDGTNSNSYYYGNSQNELITASPYFISNSRDSVDGKAKQPFDHDKALKNIVPIDVSNVVPNSDTSLKLQSSSDGTGRFITTNYGKDQIEQNYKHYIRPVADSFYKDKNSIYGFNIKTKGDEYMTSDSLKQLESDLYNKPQPSSYSQNSYSASSPAYSYLTQPANSYQDNMQTSSIQQGLQRNQNQLPSDIASMLKFDDIPYKYSQNLANDALKLHSPYFDQGGIPTPLPMRLNQNVGSHQLDVTTNLLNKFLLNKQAALNLNRPDIDSQTGGLLSTINGFKVANPFNMDLKLVAEMLKGKPTMDDSHLMSIRDQFTKPAPMKLDLSQLQLLLKSENAANIAPINEGLSALGGSYVDIYNNGRFPYQGVKYSRSQEEEESIIPIADASSTHPIGAVIEQDDSASEREVSAVTDLTGQGDDAISTNFDRPKNIYISNTRLGERHTHPNMLISGRHHYQRKYPKSDVDEPYPLLKPPPPHSNIGRSSHNHKDKHHRRRRVNKPKMLRGFKTEPLFEAGAESETMETSVPILLRPPPQVAEPKSDTIGPDEST